jgi:prepilin-type N-terminal cleavage/methylation domain-containing protein
MKLSRIAKKDLKRLSAFTLAEMMIVVAIFSLLVAAMVSLQLFAARVYTLAATKLSATADSRKMLNAMCDKIRSANTVMVGTYSGGNFIEQSNGGMQIGNALEIQYTNSIASGIATNYLIFYKDPTDSRNIVCCVTNGTTTILAKYVTNYDCFEAEDYQGNILTNYENNPVIQLTFQFSQWEYPLAVVGSNSPNAYDFYQLRARIARREK